MELGLAGKVALVTGASKGIGRAIAEDFAQEGVHLAICARGAEELDLAAKELRERDVQVVATAADVTDPKAIERVIERTKAEFGRVDILVNNAGFAELGHGVDTSDADWQYMFDVNLRSAVRFTRGVAPLMREQASGRIINVSSATARTVLMPISVDYNAAKAGLQAFSRSAAIELAPHGILVNTVCAGFIESPLADGLNAQAMQILGLDSVEDVKSALGELLLIKRRGTAEEVAAVVLFLASERASYITGSIYDVDGGYTKSVI